MSHFCQKQSFLFFTLLWFFPFLFHFIYLTFEFLNFFIMVKLQLSTFSPIILPHLPHSILPHPHCLCPCVLYTSSLMDCPLFSPIIPLPALLWLLSVCSLFQRLWLYFACLFVLLLRFHLQVTSYGIGDFRYICSVLIQHNEQ